MLKQKINKLLIGTNNKGKLREIKNLLPKNIKIHSTSEFNLKSPVENGKTFKENSLIKSKYFSKKTGLLCLADDSGIEIDILNKINEINEKDSNYLKFLDWFIYDYNLITTEKSLASMYFEDNKEKIPSSILNSYRSIFKYERINDKNYKIKDIIKNTESSILIEDPFPEESILLSMRIIEEKDEKSCIKIGHIVAYNNEYKEIIYDTLTKIFKKTKNTPNIICKNYFYVIEKDINKMISQIHAKNKEVINKEKIEHKVLDYVSVLNKIKEDKIENRRSNRFSYPLLKLRFSILQSSFSFLQSNRCLYIDRNHHRRITV